MNRIAFPQKVYLNHSPFSPFQALDDGHGFLWCDRLFRPQRKSGLG
jgi:hypothetical protein